MRRLSATGSRSSVRCNWRGHLPPNSSALFARNLANLLTAFWDKEKSELILPDDDEIVAGIRLTRGGAVVHERLKTAQ